MESIASLQINSTLNELALIRDFVEKELSALGVDPDAIFDLVYSVNEIATNILVHGYGNDGGKSGPIEIEIQSYGRAIWIAIRDKAPVYNPNDAPIPDISLPLEVRKPGGLGVYLVKEYTDKIIHRPIKGGGNEVILVKEAIL